jgi:NAD(P)-dependent dehydrogenase (short-subunit alcohol dehydrogenase family)
MNPTNRPMENRLTGKAYLITGGSTGIGFASAELLVRDGARVFLTGRNQQSLDAAQHRLGINAIALQSDTSDPEAARELVQAIRAHVERLNGVFINAGGAVLGSFEATIPQMFDEMSNTNVRGAYFVVQELLPLLGEGSTIVFNSSIASRLGQPGTSAYSASKAALTSLGRTLAVDLAPRGIRVNTLSPGPILTPAIAKIGMSEAERKQMVDRTLLKRWGRAEEVARLARFLLTDDSSFITGEEIAHRRWTPAFVITPGNASEAITKVQNVPRRRHRHIEIKGMQIAPVFGIGTE